MRNLLLTVAVAGILSGCEGPPDDDPIQERAQVSALNARSQKFGETCNLSPVISFVQPDVPPERLTTVAVSGVAEPTTNQFRVLGPWPSSIPLTRISSSVSQWTGFAPTGGDNRQSQLGIRDAYGESTMQLQGTNVGFWPNGLVDQTPYGGMQAGCWFENSSSCPGMFAPMAFPEASSKIRVSLDLRIPYDGTVPHTANTDAHAFVYINFIFRSTCPGGFIACGADKCANGKNNQLTLGIALYDGRVAQVTYPRIAYDAYAGTPVGVNGPLAGDRINGTGSFFLKQANSANFQTTPFASSKHFEAVITPESFGNVLAAIRAQFPDAMQSWDPRSYRMVTASVIDEYSQPVPATATHHAQLGMSFTNFKVVAEGPSNANVVAVSRNDAWNGVARTGIHELSAVTGYQDFVANGLTALPPQSSSWKFIAGAGDPATGRHDLIGINPQDYFNGVARTGIHVLNAATNYTTFKTEVLSALGQVDPNAWEFLPGRVNANGLPDIIAINRYDAWAGATATGIHILSGETNYQTWVGHNGLSALGPTNLHEWKFVVGRDNSLGQHRPDIIAINLNDLGGKVGFHILSGASSYQTFLFHGLTTLSSVSDANWAFVSGAEQSGQGFRDVIGINLQDLENKTGIHNFTASSGYQQRTPEVTSGLATTDSVNWVFASTPPN